MRWTDNERAIEKDMAKPVAEMIDTAGVKDIREDNGFSAVWLRGCPFGQRLPQV